MLVANGADPRAPSRPIADDLAAFDRLSPVLRELLRIAPTRIDAVSVLGYERRLGSNETAIGLMNWLRRAFPDWSF